MGNFVGVEWWASRSIQTSILWWAAYRYVVSEIDDDFVGVVQASCLKWLGSKSKPMPEMRGQKVQAPCLKYPRRNPSSMLEMRGRSPSSMLEMRGQQFKYVVLNCGRKNFKLLDWTSWTTVPSFISEQSGHKKCKLHFWTAWLELHLWGEWLKFWLGRAWVDRGWLIES